MAVPIFQVDAFTDRAFAGNPAAVCLLPAPANAEWMQKVAHNMNLSETAFLAPQGDGYELRWFTPTIEVDLCGHATLASAHVLWEEGEVRPEQAVTFHTRSGALGARRAGAWIEMDFPAEPPRPTPAPPELLLGLAATPVYVGRNRFDFLVELASEETVRNLRPNLPLLEHLHTRGIIVTSRASTPGFDFVTRFFAPRSGVPEDPVTGSAHCCLGPYWQQKLNKDELVSYQASARGGVLRVRAAGDRAIIGGQAVSVVRGQLLRCEGAGFAE
jgi:predicted PhzF superfamily epimerase YddE/YHI9